MATYYAWSNFEAGHDDKTGVATKRFPVGSKITQTDLGVSDEDWDYFIEQKVVREQPYPDMGDNPGLSPREYFIQKMQAAADGAIEEAMATVGLNFVEPEMTPEEDTKTAAKK